MPSKKRQHYVPQFYLRNFSSDGCSLHIYNIKSRKLIKNAPYDTQCYRNYFYGKNGHIEDMFMEIENMVAPIFRRIISSMGVNTINNDEFSSILIFTVLQSCRTEHAATWNNEVADKIGKLFLSKEKLLKDINLDDYQITLDDPVILSIQAAFEMYHFGLDLRCKILINKTKTKFITSDNPVIFHNQYTRINSRETSIGIACSGIQIFYPISPELLLFFYDESIYRVGSNNKNYCEIYSDIEIQNINTFQHLSALSNLFLSDANYIISKNLLSTRKEDIALVTEVMTPENEKYVFTRRHEKNLDLKVSCIAIRSRVKHKKIGFIRNPDLLMLYKDFERLTAAGKYKEWQFPDYLIDLREGNKEKWESP